MGKERKKKSKKSAAFKGLESILNVEGEAEEENQILCWNVFKLENGKVFISVFSIFVKLSSLFFHVLSDAFN